MQISTPLHYFPSKVPPNVEERLDQHWEGTIEENISNDHPHGATFWKWCMMTRGKKSAGLSSHQLHPTPKILLPIGPSREPVVWGAIYAIWRFGPQIGPMFATPHLPANFEWFLCAHTRFSASRLPARLLRFCKTFDTPPTTPSKAGRKLVNPRV